MTRSLGVWLPWWVAAAIAMGAGCAGSWPEVSARGESPFISGQAGVRTIDVMPSDVQVWAREGEAADEAEIGAAFDANVSAAVPTLLAQRGYQVVANLDWAGDYVSPRGTREHAIDTKDLVETAWALSSYGTATTRSKHAGLVPHLPHRLGEATGAEATLYIGGWAYAGEKRAGNGAKVLKVVAVVIVVAVVAVAIAAILDGKGGSIGDGLGKVASGAARAGAQAAKATARVAGGIGRATIRISSATTRVMARAASSIDTIHVDFSTSDRDCFGRVDTHTAWYRGRPDFYAEPSTPSSGPSSSMIEMTLVDNRRGVVLWHARQTFPADPKNPRDIEKMMAKMIEALPAAI